MYGTEQCLQCVPSVSTGGLRRAATCKNYSDNHHTTTCGTATQKQCPQAQPIKKPTNIKGDTPIGVNVHANWSPETCVCGDFIARCVCTIMEYRLCAPMGLVCCGVRDDATDCQSRRNRWCDVYTSVKMYRLNCQEPRPLIDMHNIYCSAAVFSLRTGLAVCSN